jgi:hypothetical protein
MDGKSVLAPHRDGHAAHLTGKRAAPEQAAPVQGLDGGAFVDAEFPQPLRLAQREAIPFYAIDIGRATGREKIKTQFRTSCFANDYHYPRLESSHLLFCAPAEPFPAFQWTIR